MVAVREPNLRSSSATFHAPMTFYFQGDLSPMQNEHRGVATDAQEGEQEETTYVHNWGREVKTGFQQGG